MRYEFEGLIHRGTYFRTFTVLSLGQTTAKLYTRFRTDPLEIIEAYRPCLGQTRMKSWDLSGYSERTTSNRPTCQKLAFGGNLSLL